MPEGRSFENIQEREKREVVLTPEEIRGYEILIQRNYFNKILDKDSIRRELNRIDRGRREELRELSKERKTEDVRNIRGEIKEEKTKEKSKYIEEYISRLVNIIERQRGKDKLWSKYIKANTIDIEDTSTLRNLSNELFEQEILQARSRGMSERKAEEAREKITEQQKIETYRETIKEAKQQQEQRLREWLEYLDPIEDETNEDRNIFFPNWFRYYVISEIKRLGKYTPEEENFKGRSKTTMIQYPDLNKESLPLVYDYLIKGKQEDLEDFKTISAEERNKELDKAIQEADFKKLYAIALSETQGELNKESIQGEWIEYTRGQAREVSESLRGKNSHLCIANEGTAQSYLEQGNLIIFYTQNKEEQNTEPRIAIRTERNKVIEIRGTEDSQESISPDLIPTVEQKLKEMNSSPSILKELEHEKKLFEIIKKTTKDKQLSKEELKFLYEIDERIQTLSYGKNPNINEIISKRNNRKDLAIALGYKEEEVSVTKEQALEGGIKYHHGDLNLNDIELSEDFRLPERITGNLNIKNLKSTKSLKLPEKIVGKLSLNGYILVKNLELLPEKIGGNLNIKNLTSAEGLVFPEKIGGDIELRSLTFAKDLILPKEIGGNLYLSGLTFAKDLILPKEIGGNLYLSGLTFAKDLILPKEIGGDLYLESLTSAEGLVFPKEVGGYLHLHNLTSAEGLVLPEKVGDDLYLNNLTSAEGLVFPKEVGGYLNLSGLTSAEGLVFPKEVGGYLNLTGLKSIKYLNFDGVTVAGKVYLSKISQEDLKEIRNKYQNIKFKQV